MGDYKHKSRAVGQQLFGQGEAEIWIKRCAKHLDHAIQYDIARSCVLNTEVIRFLAIRINQSNIWANWNPHYQQLFLGRARDGSFIYTDAVQIPYFEPDVEEYDKLVNKLRTYLTFS